MAERSSMKPAAISAPTLTPQGQLAGKPAMPLSRPFTLIGSRNRAHLHLISSSISRNHCCIIVTDNGLYLRDLASRTGALVNGRKVKESDLRDGDVIQIGSFKFKFADPAGPVRFPITPKAAGAVLRFHGVNTEIDSRTLTIGRRSNTDISLDDDGVSNTHAIVFESNGERFIRDLGSRTGTTVNGRPIHHQLLNFGDVIRIGSTEITYNLSDAEDAPQSIASERELEPLDLEPLELEPIELEPAVPAPAFPRMVETSRRIPLDKDPGDLVDGDGDDEPIELVTKNPSRNGNGAIPIELDEPEPTPTPTPPPTSFSNAFGSQPIALEPEPEDEPEPIAVENSAAESEIEPVDDVDDVAELALQTNYTVIPVEPDPDPKADSVYAMNFGSGTGIFTASTPPVAETVISEAAHAPVEETSAPIPVEAEDEDDVPLAGYEPEAIDFADDEEETATAEVAESTPAAVEPEPVEVEQSSVEPVAIEEPEITVAVAPEPEAIDAGAPEDKSALGDTFELPLSSDADQSELEPFAINEPEAPIEASEPEVFEESIASVSEPEPIAVESIAEVPVIEESTFSAPEETPVEVEETSSMIEPEVAAEESTFTAPVEVPPKVTAESVTEHQSSTSEDDFTPTLDVLTADAPTAFEGFPLAEEDTIAPPVEQSVAESAAAATPDVEIPEAESADDTAWTLEVGSPEVAATSTEVEPETAADELVGESQLTADSVSLPGEADVTTSTTADHPIRPELPPDTEPAVPALETPFVIPPVPGPDLISAASLAAAAAVVTGAAMAPTKKGRGRVKAEPKPPVPPKGRRGKKGVAPTPPPAVVEAPAPVIPPPAPTPKKRGGRKKAEPIVSMPPVELEPVETYTVAETSQLVDEPVSLAAALTDAAAEPLIVTDAESTLTTDEAVSLAPTAESQEIIDLAPEPEALVETTAEAAAVEELAIEPEAAVEDPEASVRAAEPELPEVEAVESSELALEDAPAVAAESAAESIIEEVEQPQVSEAEAAVEEPELIEAAAAEVSEPEPASEPEAIAEGEPVVVAPRSDVAEDIERVADEMAIPEPEIAAEAELAEPEAAVEEHTTQTAEAESVAVASTAEVSEDIDLIADEMPIAESEVPAAAELTEPESAIEEPAPLTLDAVEPEPEVDIAPAPIEVLDPTDPTPESAQVLEPELIEPALEEDDDAVLDQTMAGLSLTDTAFGRAVVDLGSADSAALVEELSPEPAAEEAHAESTEPEATHHLTAASELAAPDHDAFDLSFPTDDAVGTAASDTLSDTPDHADIAPATETSTPQSTGGPADFDFTLPEINEVALADLVDHSPEPEAAASIEPVGGVELITPAPHEPSHADDELAEHVQHPESNLGDDFDLPDVDLHMDLSGDDVGLGMDEPEPVSPTPTKSQIDPPPPAPVERAPEPEALVAKPIQNPQPAPAAQTATNPAPATSTDPFFGMNRDLASFLGGVPLTLTSATPIAPVAEAGISSAFSAAGAIQGLPSTSPATLKQMPAPAAPVAPQTPPPTAPIAQTPPARMPPPTAQPPVAQPAPVQEISEDVDLDDLADIPDIDFSSTDEPLDLFEEDPHKLDAMPDTLAPITDVSSVLSPPKPPQAPPAPAAVAPAPTPSTGPAPVVTIRPSPPAASPMRNVTPPPPPRTAPLRSFTGSGNVTPPPMVPGAGPVSFGGAPAAGGLTAPFGAVGTPGGRQVDVFSHTAFPPLDPSVFSAPQRPASPRPVTEGAAAQRSDVAGGDIDDDEESSTADDVLAIELDSLPDLATTPVRRTAIPPNQQQSAARPTVAPAKKPWWKSLKILLPLVVVAIIVVILVVMFLQPKHTVQGTLKIDGLDSDMSRRSAQVNRFRARITDPEVRKDAVANEDVKKIGPGFLNDPLALTALASGTTSPFNDSENELQLNRQTADVQGDSIRIKALMNAVFARSGKDNDDAATSEAGMKRAHDAANQQQAAQDTQQKAVNDLSHQLLISGGTSAANWLLNPQVAVTQVQAAAMEAQQAADAAASDVQKKRLALQDAQTAAAPADANVAAESQRVKKGIADLNVRLTAVQDAQAGHADESAKRFATSVDAFDKLLSDAAGGALAPAPVTDARNAVTEIRDFDSNLAAKTRDDSKSVAQLRRQIADRRESHLRQIWSSDTSLQGLVEERNAQSHRYGAAIDSNYVDEAAKIKGVVEELDKKIEARRSELATGGQLNDPLQQTLQQTIDRTEAARQAGESQMTQKLQTLAAMFVTGGAAASMTAAPKLSQAAADALLARQAYATASSLTTSSADAEARRLQLQIAEQQARLDSLQQDPGTAGPVDAARRALDAAQSAEAKATTTYTAAHNNAALLQQLVDAQKKLDDTAKESQLAQKNVGEVVASPKLNAPGNAAIIYARDQRFIYLLGGLAAVLAIFAAPLWMTLHDMSRDKHAAATGAPAFEPVLDPNAPALISSDRDSLFEPDTAHA